MHESVQLYKNKKTVDESWVIHDMGSMLVIVATKATETIEQNV